ncbi:MAG: C1 family peptidase [Bacteroidia bacterium]|nr:C1 family peptidase [Bacteroidia bacterium]
MMKLQRVFHMTALLLILPAMAFAQEETITNKPGGGYHFTIEVEHGVTSVKNQSRSSTCWSFSTLSFLESELMRMGKGEYNLSEMYVVRNTYLEKARKYVRMHGSLNFAGGGAFHDVTAVLKTNGLVPESAYPGLIGGSSSHNHGELDAVTKAVCDAVIEHEELSSRWFPAFTAILDAYLGEYPASFEYNGQSFTPTTFTASLGLNADDYVELSSYTHHPFYETFMLEVPDNWDSKQVYNLPIDEMMATIDHALENGYTVAWAADVSEKGFLYRDGVAVVPANGDFTAAKDAPLPQLTISQDIRQEAFDNFETTDDHGMHITGIAKDQNGDKYYIVKNSWGDSNACGGYLYASEAYVRYKTMDVMVHKASVPKKVAKKLGL